MKQYRITGGCGLEALAISEAEIPRPGPGQVLVRLRAASLNYRDLLIIRGHYPAPLGTAFIPLSDGAGEVVALGPGVARFAVGSRVAGIFMQSWLAGGMADSDNLSALGGGVDGVLAEYRVFDAQGLVEIPQHLSFAEAACLPCAGVTAWNALHGGASLLPGQSVLVLGTGGVSIFALQFARAAGARVIVTSSSDAKLERALALGAHHGINYVKQPGWGTEVRRLTGGRGVDFVVETGGAGTLPSSIAATARGGHIPLIGVLTAGQIDPLPILTGGVSLRGVMVGSRAMFEAMNTAIAVSQIRPVIDRVFGFAEAPAAYASLAAAAHLGKLVIDIS